MSEELERFKLKFYKPLFGCCRCHKQFLQLNHIRSHVCLGTFICKKCDSIFKLENQFRSHQQAHMASSPYYCPECNSDIAVYEEFRLHCTIFHPDAIFYNCDKCKRVFRIFWDFWHHQQSHEEEEISSALKSLSLLGE